MTGREFLELAMEGCKAREQQAKIANFRTTSTAFGVVAMKQQKKTASSATGLPFLGVAKSNRDTRSKRAYILGVRVFWTEKVWSR